MCVVKAKSHDRRPRVPPGGFSVQTRSNVPVCFKVSCTGSPLCLLYLPTKWATCKASLAARKKSGLRCSDLSLFFSRTTKHALWVRNSRGASVAFSWFQYPQYRLIHQHGINMWCYRRSSSDALFLATNRPAPDFVISLMGRRCMRHQSGSTVDYKQPRKCVCSRVISCQASRGAL